MFTRAFAACSSKHKSPAAVKSIVFLRDAKTRNKETQTVKEHGKGRKNSDTRRTTYATSTTMCAYLLLSSDNSENTRCLFERRC